MFSIFAQEAAFDPLLIPYRARADHIMVGMNLFLMLVCLALSPLHDSYPAAIAAGLPILLFSIWLARRHSGKLFTRLFMACGFMAYTGLIIHQTQGDIEAHFSAFGLIGILLYYRDWRTMLAASIFIYLHHMLLGYAQTLGAPVYVFDNPHFNHTFLIHIAYFIPFILTMGYLSVWLRREGYEDQRVIALAQRIIQGHLIEEEPLNGDIAQMPLISSVISMKNRLLDLLRVLPVAAAVIRIETGTIVSINDAWKRALQGFDFRVKIGQSSIWTEAGTWERLLQTLRNSSENFLDKMEVKMTKCDGSLFLAELSLVVHDDIDPAMAILTFEDITRRRESEQTMQRLAYRDLLTDLPNRTSLYAELDKALSAWRINATPFAVIMIDLDGFKPINDSYGHDTGDKVLKIIAARLLQLNRKSDLAARLGGDEFAIVVRDIQSLEATLPIAQRLIDTLSQPICLDNPPITVAVGASGGTAYITEGCDCAETILKNADTALYQAKADGKGHVRCFRPQTVLLSATT